MPGRRSQASGETSPLPPPGNPDLLVPPPHHPVSSLSLTHHLLSLPASSPGLSSGLKQHVLISYSSRGQQSAGGFTGLTPVLAGPSLPQRREGGTCSSLRGAFPVARLVSGSLPPSSQPGAPVSHVPSSFVSISPCCPPVRTLVMAFRATSPSRMTSPPGDP